MAIRLLNVANPTSMNHVPFSGDSFIRPFSLPTTKITKTCTRQLVVTSGIPPTRIAQTSSCLARLWREIHGLNDWENLVEPLDPLLQQEIIRYGEFVIACYKAFELDPNSKRYLHCKYGKRNMLHNVGLENSGYEVTKYIYATPDVSILTKNDAPIGRWIGYVAVSSNKEVKRLGRRDIMVTFRGTVTNAEWVTNFMSSLTPACLDPHKVRTEVKVETGFLSLYTSKENNNKFGLRSCREQLLSEISLLLKKYKGEEISITLAGHSMGSSLAILLAYDIAELGINRNNNLNHVIPITVFSFGGPRVGNSGFKERCEELGLKVLRIVNVNDPIPKMPGFIFNENFRVLGGKWRCLCYAHVGVEIALDFFVMGNPSCVHDLEMYIRLLKCPKPAQIQKKGLDFLDKARLVLFRAQELNTLEWTNAAVNMVNIALSLTTSCM